MRKFLRKILDIDQSEEGRVYMLLANSFFLGIFIVTYDVSMSTLFLDKFTKLAENPLWQVKSVIYRQPLSISIVATGILGIFTTVIFAALQNIISYARLTIITLVFSLLAVSSIALLFKSDLIVPGTENYYILIFVSFCLLGPLNAITLLGFYGTVSRAFTLKQEKKITGTVDQGGMIAISIAFFAVFFIEIKEEDFLYISAFGVFTAFLIQAYFIVRYKNDRLNKLNLSEVKQANNADSSIGSLIKNKYVRLLSLMFMLSVVANIFVEYSFLKSSSATFPDASDLSNFLALYGGVLTILSLLLQIFIGDRIIEQYGVKVALLVLPIIVAFFTLLAGMIGMFEGGAKLKESLMFFVFIALSKLFFSITKDTFEDPILKNFFIPLDFSIRHDVQAKVEGVFRQFSWALAGLAIFAFALLTFINLEHYSFILVAICVGYMITSTKLYDSYRFTLLDSLNVQKSRVAATKKEYSPINVMKKEIYNHEPEKVIYTLKLMEKIEPLMLEDSSNELVYDLSPDIRKYAIQKLNDSKSISSIGTLKNVIKLEDSDEVKKIANQALDQLNEAETLALSSHKLYSLAKSTDPKERELAAKLIYKSINDTNTQTLIDLMRDPNQKVRIAAIISAGKSGRSEFWPLLIEYMGSPMFGNIAAASVFAVGERILPTLESAFYKSGQTSAVMMKIVQLYGRFGGDEVIDYLWNKVDFPDKKVVAQVLLSLSSCNFQAVGHKSTRILQVIESEIGSSAWSITAYTEIGDDEGARNLKNAIIEEIESTDNDIFMLLSLVYDPNSIQLVRQNIESRTSEGIVYAIELLNVFIADELKPVLFPLLDEITIHEKIEKLQDHYLREQFNQVDILLELINRDYNFINRWTKACAIYRYCQMPGVKVVDDLVANLFNPDALLRETAAYAIYKLDKQLYNIYTKRVHADEKKLLDTVILSQEHKENRRHLKIEKVFLLKEIQAFASIPGVFLSGIADTIEDAYYRKEEYIVRKGDKGSSPLFVIVSGKVEIRDGKNVISTIAKGDLVGEKLVLESDINLYDVVAIEDTHIYKIEKEHFYEMMSQSHEMTEGVIAGIVEHKVIKEKDALVEELLEEAK